MRRTGLIGPSSKASATMSLKGFWWLSGVALMIGACTSRPSSDQANSSTPPPFVYNSFVAGGNATGLSPHAVMFLEAMEENRAKCVSEAGQQLGLASVKASDYCDCQFQVFARLMAQNEMSALVSEQRAEATAVNPPVEQVIIARDALIRIAPERRRICGY
jgi:hypothetical protein